MEQALNPALYKGRPSYLAKLVIELTNHCNLRCRYCHQNRPIFTPDDPVSEENFDNILKFARRNSLNIIDLVGGGDILMYPAWAEKCKRLLDAGIKLSTTINLGK